MKGGKNQPLAVGVPLGKIIPRRFKNDRDLVVLHQARSPIAERYRRLASKLDGIRTIVVTSAAPSEGKTITSVNLALAFAELRDRSTLLIDGDLRRPSVTRYITPPPKLGLSEVLAGDAPLEHALLSIEDSSVSILPAGTHCENPPELLQLDYLGSVMVELQRMFDRIVIDTPPIVPFTDASVFNAHADGALVVLRAGSTPTSLFEQGLENLQRGNLLGVVLNGTPASRLDHEGLGYDYYNNEREREAADE
jgi:receptor protein-tyrosine kinase